MAYTNYNNSKDKAGAEAPKLSHEEWLEQKQIEKEQLYHDIDDTAEDIVVDEASFRDFLDVQARLDRYSAGNALLIFSQMPEASQLKDFNAWAEAKAQIKKGEKGISILEPIEYTRKDGQTGTTFKVKKVFDVTQTTARKKPAPTVNRDPVTLVTAMLETCPIDYDLTEGFTDKNMAAYYDNSQNKLFVKENVGDSTVLFQAVAQELALSEISINSDNYNRREAIYPAMCASYMLCKKYGVDTKNIAIGRVAEAFREKEPKEIRSLVAQSRNALSEIHTRMYEELNRNRKPREQEQER